MSLARTSTLGQPLREHRVLLYGLFGIGNLGNEGSLAAFANDLQAHHPELRLRCASADPRAVLQEHGLAGTSLMTRPGTAGSRVSLASKLVARVIDVPRTFALVGQADSVVVPGMGVLEETLGVRPWGLPFMLFVTSAACKLRGRGFALVSVGAERPDNPFTRRLFAWTLRLSSYRSYRDEGSLEAARAMGLPSRCTDVFPDLAFALPEPPPRVLRRGHVAIGVMAYYGSRDDRVSGAPIWQRYVEDMVRFIGQLVDAGRTITVLIGDRIDRATAEEVTSRVLRDRPHARDSVVISAAATLEALMHEMSTAEAVVASRFHNLVCALRLAKPTVSVGYAAKNDELMAAFGLGAYCQRLGSLDLELLSKQLEEVVRTKSDHEAEMRATLASYQEALTTQSIRLSQDLLRVESHSGVVAR